MERLNQQVRQAFQELSVLARGGTSADIVLAKVTAYELSQLKVCIDEARLKGDQQELKRCLEKCQHLQVSIRAVRKIVEHDAQRDSETSAIPA